MTKKTVGILGGMGPEATADLFLKVIKATPASKDQEHLRIIVDCNPQIPDRTAAILRGGEDPRPALVETAKNVERAGADLILIPCNTAHYFYDVISAAVSIPVLHIMNETAEMLSQMGIRKVGLLATDATLQFGLYDRALEKKGIGVLIPAPAGQKQVMNAIYGVKAGEFVQSRQLAMQAAMQLIEMGAEAVIAGCTEIPLILRDGDLAKPLVDATLALAKAAVREALAD